jgi:hypothetical protein
LNNFDPILPGRYSTWINTLETLRPDTQLEWLRMAGVGAQEAIDGSQPGGVRLDPIFAKFANRFLIYTCASWSADPADVLNRMETIQPGEELLVLEGEQRDLPCEQHVTPANKLVDVRPDEVRLSVDAPTKGWLFAPMTFYPGWEARVDGVQVSVVHANYLFMAVPVPSGKHEIILQYRSIYFYLGALLSILVIVLIISWNVWRSKRPKQTPSISA